MRNSRHLMFIIRFFTACVAAGNAAAVSVEELADREEIRDLVYCYALGADTIGNGSLGAAAEKMGLDIFTGCFTEQATFAVWPAGMPFDRLAFPSRKGDRPPAFIIEGRAAWAGAINASFRGPAGGVGYDFVQHNLTNIDIDIDGNSADVTAYLSSVHVIRGESMAAMRCRQEAHGTYSLRVSKEDGSWMITSLDLAQIAYDAVIENGGGCSGG